MTTVDLSTFTKIFNISSIIEPSVGDIIEVSVVFVLSLVISIIVVLGAGFILFSTLHIASHYIKEWGGKKVKH